MTLLTHGTRASGRATASILALVLAFSGFAAGQRQEPAPAPSNLELRELNAALEVVRKQLDAEKRKNAGQDAKNRALAESLAESNRLLASIRSEHEELLLRMASLGVDLLKPDPKSLEQRLLNTVRERDLVEQENENLARQLLRLSEVAVHVMRTATGVDATNREMLDREIRAAGDVLGPATATARGKVRALGEGKVVSIDPEIGLVVLNVGQKSGVRVGMPLRILRSQTVIGTAMVVDVRDSIAGAVLQKIALEGQDVKVGDRIQPVSQQL